MNDDSDIEPPCTVELEINGTNLNFKIDADIDIISKRQYDRIMSQPQLNTCYIRHDSVSGHERDCKSKIYVSHVTDNLVPTTAHTLDWSFILTAWISHG